MTPEEIRKLLLPLRQQGKVNFAPPLSDYQLLRNEESRSFSMAVSFSFFGLTTLASRFASPSWLVLSLLFSFSAFAGFMALRGYKYRKACAVFERYCPGSLAELEENLKTPATLQPRA